MATTIDRDRLAAAAQRIREHAASAVGSAIEIGRELRAAKEMIPHGSFGEWLTAEFAWSVRQAQRLMLIADRFGSTKYEQLVAFATSTLATLAASDLTDEQLAEVVEAGPITASQAKRVVAELDPVDVQVVTDDMPPRAPKPVGAGGPSSPPAPVAVQPAPTVTFVKCPHCRGTGRIEEL